MSRVIGDTGPVRGVGSPGWVEAEDSDVESGDDEHDSPAFVRGADAEIPSESSSGSMAPVSLPRGGAVKIAPWSFW